MGLRGVGEADNTESGLRMTTVKGSDREKGFGTVGESKKEGKSLQAAVNIKEEIISSAKCSTEI